MEEMINYCRELTSLPLSLMNMIFHNDFTKKYDKPVIILEKPVYELKSNMKFFFSEEFIICLSKKSITLWKYDREFNKIEE